LRAVGKIIANPAGIQRQAGSYHGFSRINTDESKAKKIMKTLIREIRVNP
jgi:hypothetical protein